MIHQSGRGISFVEALARNLVRFVDYLPGFYAVGIVAIFLAGAISVWATWLPERLWCVIAGSIRRLERDAHRAPLHAPR